MTVEGADKVRGGLAPQDAASKWLRVGPVTMVLMALIGAGCTTPAERCASARQEAAHAWGVLADELGPLSTRATSDWSATVDRLRAERLRRDPGYAQRVEEAMARCDALPNHDPAAGLACMMNADPPPEGMPSLPQHRSNLVAALRDAAPSATVSSFRSAFDEYQQVVRERDLVDESAPAFEAAVSSASTLIESCSSL